MGLKYYDYIDEHGVKHILSNGKNDPIFLYKWRAYQPSHPEANRNGWRYLNWHMSCDVAQEWAAREGVNYEKDMEPREETGEIRYPPDISGW